MYEFRKYLFPVLSILFFTLASIQEHQTLKHQPEKKLIQAFQHTLHRQELELSEYLNIAAKRITDSPTSENYATIFSDLNELFEKEGLGFVIFQNQKMVYWSSNHFSFPNLQSKFPGENGLVILPNGIFEARKRVVGDFQLMGLIHIKNNYSYENQFLINSFIAPFELPANFNITADKSKSSYEIRDLTNQYLFSVVPTGKLLVNASQLYFSAFLYSFGLLFLLLALYRKMDDYREENFVSKMLLLMVVLFVIYWIHIIFGIPDILNHLEIFGPRYYAISTWLPSLGDFFL
ncbi:MAG: hypothetical protein Q8K69_15500, partial [Bacteroidota bacterium]|nr:hypothetical protein [Bacteroidota bacterium]